jgi:putative sigma-54 modulation protein
MRTEFAGRQLTITKKLKALAERGLERIGRVLGDGCSAHVVITAEKTRQKAEVTVTFRQRTFVGSAEGYEAEGALQMALVRAEKQALRLRTRLRTLKREPKQEKSAASTARVRKVKALPVPADRAEGSATANGKNGGSVARKMAVMVHSFPSTHPMPEPHIVRSQESVALRPMTLEEAVKEAEFRDREVFVFRSLEGSVHVLHRKRDGKMTLIDAP